MTSTTADRTIVVSRMIDAPRELVFEAFTEVRHLSQWWGPSGFTTTTASFQFRAGGVWNFTMHGPDGTDYPEWITFVEITPPERITLRHGEFCDDPNAFDSVSPSTPLAPRPASRCEQCSPPNDYTTRPSKSITPSRADDRPWTTSRPTSRRFKPEDRADGGQSILQCIDVVGRVHRTQNI